MNNSVRIANSVTYRLALILPDRGRFLTIDIGGTKRLPCVAIPIESRLAEEISHSAARDWGLTIVILDIISVLAQDGGLVIAEVFESSENCSSRAGAAWSSVSEMPHGTFCDAELDILMKLIEVGATGRGPFSRLGWCRECIAWLQSETAKSRFIFSGQIKQINASATFCLLRLGNANGPAYWLKAAGDPNETEFSITTRLATLFPDYVPNIVAARRDWNAWVMEDAGCRLTQPPCLEELEIVAQRLGELQVRSIEHQNILISSGCIDQRLRRIRESIPNLRDYLIEAMANQTSTRARTLSSTRLHEISVLLLNACDLIERLCIPDTLIHNDFTAGNILIKERRCVFTDWAEAYVGVPFITYQHLRAYVSRDPHGHEWLPHLDDIYKKCWRGTISPSLLERAFIVAPLLALASYLLGRGNWFGSERSRSPQFQRYARGLARHMDDACRLPTLQEVLCG